MKSAVVRTVRCPAILLALLLLVAGSSLSATGPESFAGEWKGAIDIGGTPLDIVVEIAVDSAAGNLTGTCDVPAQGAKDLPLSRFKLSGNNISFYLQVSGGATFEGTLSPNGTKIAGTFHQHGQKFPFHLERQSAPTKTTENTVRQPADSTAQALADLDEYITSIMEQWHVPGLAISIVRDGDIVYAQGFGFRNLSEKLPVTTRTLFGIGSSTKAFTALLTGMLVDEGKLNWDEPIQNYIPGFRLEDEFATRRATLRDFLTHRSGLPRHDIALIFNTDLTRKQIVDNLEHLPFSADFRTTYQYNNYGYILAGYLLEQITGHTWEDLVRERIFQPLGMKASNLSIAELTTSADYALPYALQGESHTRTPFWELGAAAPAGAINSNVLDMAEWVKMQLNGGTLDDGQLISPAQLQAMHSPQIICPPMLKAPEIEHTSYGLGWFVESYRGHYHVHHGGNTIGYTALVSFLPKEDIGIVVLANLHGTPAPQIVAYRVIDLLLGLKPVDWNARLQAAQNTAEQLTQQLNKTEKKSGTKPAHDLKEYTGQYEHPIYGTISIELEDGALVARYYEANIKLTHLHYEVFTGKLHELLPLTVPFQFVTNLDGEVDQLRVGLEQAVKPISFTRRPAPELSQTVYLQKLTGTYNVMGQIITISLTDGVLTMKVPGQPTYQLSPGPGNSFKLQGIPGYSVEFALAEGATRASEIILKQPNGTFRGQRQ